MGMMEIEQGSLIEMHVSPGAITPESGFNNGKQTIKIPAERRAVLSLEGWLCECIDAKLFIRHGRKRITQASDGLSLSFSPANDIEIKYSSGTNKTETVHGVISIYIREGQDHTILEYTCSDIGNLPDSNSHSSSEEPYADDGKDSEMSDAEIIRKAKSRIETYYTIAATMEKGNQVKKGLIPGLLKRAEEEIKKAENNEGLVSDCIRRANGAIEEAEALIARVIQKQEGKQNNFEKASQTTETINY